MHEEKNDKEELEAFNPGTGGAAERDQSAVASYCQTLKTKEFWKDRFPCTYWIPTYNLESFICDVIAGVTTALTVIPQGIGYAPLAGLPLQYGLYGSIMPGFTYCLLGTTKEATIGPTAVNSIMSFNYAGGNPSKAVTLGFFAGIIEFIMGLLNLGFLLQFVSGPVITAFSSAVSIQVITSQIKGIFGLAYPGRGFVKVWIGLFSNITQTSVPDLVAGIISLAILYALRKLKELKVFEGNDPEAKRAKIVKKTKWLLSISANCIVVIIGCGVAFVLLEFGHDILKITGEVEGGLPPFQLPWYFGLNSSLPSTEANASSIANLTEPIGGNGSPDVVEIIQELGPGLIMLPLVSLLQHLAIAKFYAGPRVMKASQEMIALGVSQTLGSFVGSLSVTASFGRSAVNSTSGVRTTFGGVITGVIILMACAVLSPALAFIPTSVLSAVIIFSMFFTIDYNLPYFLAKHRNMDFIPYTVTFLLGIFYSVESGLILGTLIHSLLLVYMSTKLKIRKTISEECTIIRPNKGLFYPSIESLRSTINSAAESGKPIILDLSLTAGDLDYTSTKTLLSTLTAVEKSGKPVAIVADLQDVQLMRSMSTKDWRYFDTVEEAVQAVREPPV